jgi:hypothetical protein
MGRIKYQGRLHQQPRKDPVNRLKCWGLPTKLHSVETHKTVIWTKQCESLKTYIKLLNYTSFNLSILCMLLD